MTRRDAFCWLNEQHLGEPYVFGGDDPWGQDCSGIAVADLCAVGRLPWGTDMSADSLRSWGVREHLEVGTSELRQGCLVFFLDPVTKHAGHVEIIWRLPSLTIGASGGTSKHRAPGYDPRSRPTDAVMGELWDIKRILEPVRAEALAKETNAFVKVHPWQRRPGPYAFVDPFRGEA